MIQLMIVENHRPYLGAIRQLLEPEKDIQIAFVAFSPSQALQMLNHHLVDIVLTDLYLGQGNESGVELAASIHSAYPSVETLLITSHPRGEDLIRAQKAGIGGMVDKHRCEKGLVTAIRSIYQGNTYFCPELEKLARQYERKKLRSIKNFQAITNFESQILSLMARGLSVIQIAKLIRRRPSFIEVIRRNLMKKFQVYTNAALLQTAQQYGHLPFLLQG